MIIWSDEILKEIEGDVYLKRVHVQIGDSFYPITGIEDSTSAGWYEIRYSPTLNNLRDSISVSYLRSNLPEDFMVMLQELNHTGRSYPINTIYRMFNGDIVLKCDNPDTEYWEELEKWKIEEDKNGNT